MIKNLCWELLHDTGFGNLLQLRQQAEPAQPSRCQDHRIDLSFPRPLDSGLDIPPDRHDVDLEVVFRRPVDHLHRPPWSSGADPGAVGKII
jgi:hypothetical protein